MADTTTVGLGERLQRLEDELSVRDVLSAFCRGIDERDGDVFMSIWAPDASWTIGPDTFDGTDAIHQTWKASCDSTRWSRHMAGNPTITWGENTATVRSELYGTATMQDGSPNSVVVTMRDEFSRTPNGWVITRRIVDMPEG